MSGIAKVAELAGVSKSTASRALTGAGYVSESTRARVIAAAATIGYVPSTSAVSLATGRTRTIGVVMPYVNRWFFAEVLEGIQEALLEHGLDLTLYDAKPGSAGRRRIFEDFLARKRFDGLIAVGLEPADDELERMRAIDRPLVTVVGEDPSTSVVAIDDDHAVRRATEHLIALGHDSIVFLGGGAGSNWAHVDRRRLDGYLEAMADADLGDHVRHVPSDVSLPGGYAAAVDLLGGARRTPTAIVGVCDEVAIGAIIASRRLGIRVPTDLSVVGIDDHEYAEMFALTTLEQVPRSQGLAAVELLLAHIADPDHAPRQVRLQARLVMRSSTAPPATHETAAVGDMRVQRRRFADE
ncbi:LacI family DNA-binding transcriptional regulator [Microbacterium hominis]|uniref:LacI family DNA-binding transcriptional regulator n=1 Tax=Microbacterium hominis TaxID=162426 RepID=A0A7D4TLZ0_9MICO|nr:LacI family DNA-binding transcriptional regulator [Microbacterium hominis]QKJ18662.1 LacI family DNA-binding transcriptional regulator [Microbacterium hominis]